MLQQKNFFNDSRSEIIKSKFATVRSFGSDDNKMWDHSKLGIVRLVLKSPQSKMALPDARIL